MLSDEDEYEQVARMKDGPPDDGHSVVDGLPVPPWARELIAGLFFLVCLGVYFKLTMKP